MLSRRPRHSRHDRGAVALLTAVLAVVLFGAGAMAIDLGNAYARARSQQTRADLAALSAGSLLPAKTPLQQQLVADQIASYINSFHLQNDGPSLGHHYTGLELLTSGAVTFPTADRVLFKAPSVRVKVGLARVLGADDIDVTRAATVEVFSIKENVVAPLYAVQGCDYGAQVLKDSPNGQSAPTTVPSMDLTGTPNNQISMTTVNPASIAANATPAPTLGLTGDFNGGNNPHPSLIDAVGFFRDNTGPTPYTVQPVTPTAVTATSANVVVPSTVLSTPGFWYLRVRESGKWSTAVTTAVLTVGDVGTPTCPASSAGGNFGMLGFGDSSNPNTDIATVFKKGPAKTVVTYPNTPAPTFCNGQPAPALIYNGTVDNANCVYTAGGFKPDAATAGLLSDSDARLNKNTTPACGSSRTTVGGYSINNDYLSCFLTNSTTTLATIESGSYSGPAVISADIVKSPRFFFVPVFATEPATGTSKAYPIIEFRPAFLTDQPPTATRATGPSSGNGITMCCSNKVQSLNFILFSAKALPEDLDSGLPTSPTYIFGPKVIKLVN